MLTHSAMMITLIDPVLPFADREHHLPVGPGAVDEYRSIRSRKLDYPQVIRFDNIYGCNTEIRCDAPNRPLTFGLRQILAHCRHARAGIDRPDCTLKRNFETPMHNAPVSPSDGHARSGVSGYREGLAAMPLSCRLNVGTREALM
jgi:hypothetical protein